MVRHLDLIKWDGQSARQSAPVVEVYGSSETKIARDTRFATEQLKSLPKADRVIIGQKGALESALGNSLKANIAIEFANKNPQLAEKLLTPAELRIISKQKELGETASAFKKASDWKRIFEKLDAAGDGKLKDQVRMETVSIDNASHSITDVLVKTKDGKTLRYRLVSNVWGDEIVPIAQALKATGHTQIIYAGTAGALPGSGLKVGDLLIPDSVLSSTGARIPLSSPIIPIPGSTAGGAVAHVGTPYEETNEWLDETRKKASAVELETGYLGEVFSDPKSHQVQVNLLISDVVGSEGETLDAASSADRRKSLDRFLESVFQKDRISHAQAVMDSKTRVLAQSEAIVLPTRSAGDQITTWLREAYPGRDPASLYQLRQHTLSQLLPSPNPPAQIPIQREKVLELATSSKSFTTARLESILEKGGELIRHLLTEAERAGISPQLAIDSRLLDGTFNPAQEKCKAALVVQDPSLAAQLETLLSELKKKVPDANKLFQFSVIRGPPEGSEHVILPPNSFDTSDRLFLSQLYQESAQANAGFTSSISRTGGLKLVHIPELVEGAGCSFPQKACGLSFFAPDPETQIALEKLPKKPSAEAAAAYFTSIKPNLERTEVSFEPITDGNRNSPQTHFRMVQVDRLAEGELAQITPRLTSNGEIEIVLSITDEGLRSPPVILEEAIHLKKIYDSKAFTAQNFPEEFAEIVWNAEAVSPRAKHALAKLELEAMREAQKGFSTDQEQKKILGKMSPEEKALYEDYFAKRVAHAEKIYEEASREVKKDLRARTKKWELRKSKLNDLDQLPDKLNDLVQRNDRKGTAALIREYLPWELMEPSEIAYWESMLESMTNPDTGRKEFYFRGLDEFDRRVFDNNNGALFSTILSRNQGNYSRRLRSIAAKKPSYQAAVNLNFTEINPGSETWSAGHFRHSMDPKASPYISLTRRPSIASIFAGSGMVALEIDSRRILPNWVSGYGHEIEHLAPLIIFPDEIVESTTYPSDISYDERQRKITEFGDIFKAKTGRDFDHLSTGKGFTLAELRRPYELMGAQGPDYSSGPDQIRNCLLKAYQKYR